VIKYERKLAAAGREMLLQLLHNPDTVGWRVTFDGDAPSSGHGLMTEAERNANVIVGREEVHTLRSPRDDPQEGQPAH